MSAVDEDIERASNDSRQRAPLVAWVDAIGVRGPGLAGWRASREVLAGRAAHDDRPTVLVAPDALPPAERRRVGKGVRVALEVAFEAVAGLDADVIATLPSVFTSSSGDGDNCDAICRALADDRLISPTRFHNSVHNAPSGYWGIASGSMASSTSLCAYDDSFAVGLDDALAQVACGADPVLLVAYDAPYPEPLHAERPTPDAFAVALLLSGRAGPRSIARLESTFRSEPDAAPSRMTNASLERCRAAIPAARSLPLLEAIAMHSTGDVTIAQSHGMQWRFALRFGSTIGVADDGTVEAAVANLVIIDPSSLRLASCA